MYYSVNPKYIMQNQNPASDNDKSVFRQRKSPRAEFHNYAGGEYFVTICTHDKKHYFGHIKDGKMFLSPIGKIAHKLLTGLSSHYSYADIPLFVVMPNHIHLIICINNAKKVSEITIPQESEDIIMQRPPLSIVIGGFKQSVTMQARANNMEFGWQSRYHDHIIRNSNNEKLRITDYIKNNVINWDKDCFYSE